MTKTSTPIGNSASRLIFLVTLLLPLVANSSTTYGHGTKSCGTWSKERKAESIESRYYEIWVLGFISGTGTILEVFRRTQEKTDADAALAYIDKYCTERPLAPIGEASEVLILELSQQK